MNLVPVEVEKNLKNVVDKDFTFKLALKRENSF